MQYLFALTLLFAPLYAWRFDLYGLPVNGLMVWLFALWVCFALWVFAQKRVHNFLLWFLNETQSPYFWCAGLFSAAGRVALYTGGSSVQKLGQFIVLFFQPLVTFVLFRYVLCAKDLGKSARVLFVRAALVFVAAAGLYAALQYFTLIGVPQEWWGNSQEPKRALAFFLHPNFYALFVAPLLAFLLPSTLSQDAHSPLAWPRTRGYASLPVFLWFLGAAGLLLSLSRGGWFGLAVAGGVYVLVSRNGKLIRFAVAAAFLSVILVAAVPNLRYRVLLPFSGEKSTVARFSLWHTGARMIADNPIAGKGLLGFSRNWCMYNTDPGLASYPAPHNIVLNFWVETGLLGLLSFMFLVALALWRGLRRRATPLQLGLALACVAMLAHGLIDIPYLKNDLALLFWLLFAFI